jgi:mycothiol synthase
MQEPRPYRDARDLAGMQAVLQAGRRAGGSTFYAHSGDLRWWLFYLEQDQDPRERIYLWESDAGDVTGWALFSPQNRSFDVFVHPAEGGRLEERFLWAEDRMAGLVRTQGGRKLRTMWISEHDARLIAHLASRGFVRSDYHVLHMVRPLDGNLPSGPLPEGYAVRHVAGVHEARARAGVAYVAFGSEKPFDRYAERTLRFMHSPVYAPELDLVTVAPDGRFASFCICWLDDLNRVGLLEPVGTHPEFRRKGLGRVVVSEGLRRMQARGMTTATICAEGDNPAARQLYESLGFRLEQRIHTFVKAL